MCESEYLSHKRPAPQKGGIMASHYKGPKGGCLLGVDPLKRIMKASAIFQRNLLGDSERPLWGTDFWVIRPPLLVGSHGVFRYLTISLQLVSQWWGIWMIVKHKANRCFSGTIGVGETYLMRNQGIPVQFLFSPCVHYSLKEWSFSVLVLGIWS